MEIAGQIERLFTEQWLRMTVQRRVQSDADDHPNAEEICHRSVAMDPKISIMTVCRTPRIFEGAEILQRLEFGKSGSRHGMAEQDSDAVRKHVIRFENDDCPS